MNLGTAVGGWRERRASMSRLRSPRAFFREMPVSGGYLEPALRAYGWLLAASSIDLAMSGPARAGWSAEIFWTLTGPAFLLGAGFAGAGLLWCVWRAMGSSLAYEASFRCWAALSPLSVLSALFGSIPVVNAALFAVSIGLLAVASEEAHRLPRFRSWAVFGGIGAAFLLLSGASGPSEFPDDGRADVFLSGERDER